MPYCPSAWARRLAQDPGAMGLSIGGRPHRTASASASSNSESLSASGTMAGRGKVAEVTGRPYLWGSGEAGGGSGCAEGLEGVEGVATVGPGVLDRPPGICASGRSTLAHGSCTLVGACHDTILKWGHWWVGDAAAGNGRRPQPQPGLKEEEKQLSTSGRVPPQRCNHPRQPPSPQLQSVRMFHPP